LYKGWTSVFLLTLSNISAGICDLGPFAISLQYLQYMKAQDIWFFVLISEILAQLRLVGICYYGANKKGRAIFDPALFVFPI
jgi:hypothetical protein